MLIMIQFIYELHDPYLNSIISDRMAPKVAGMPSRKNKKGLRSDGTSGGYICRHCHKDFNAAGYSEFNAHQKACGKLVSISLEYLNVYSNIGV